MPRGSSVPASGAVHIVVMALTNLVAQAAPAAAPAKLNPGDLLWAALPLIGILLLGAFVLYLFDRWRKRSATARGEVACNDQLSHFRSLYERGEMSREEFERVKGLLAGQLRHELKVPSLPVSSPSPPLETGIQPSPDSPPPAVPPP